MTREAIKGLRVSSRIAVLRWILATGAALSLGAAPPPQPAGLQDPAQESQEPTLETTLTVSPTIATTTPSPAATSTLANTETPTASPTATAPPTDTPFSSPLGTPTVTQPPSALATPPAPPTATPAPTNTPTSTPMPPVTPTSVPTPTATPTLSPIEKIISYIPGNSLLAAAICLIPLFLLGLLLILAVLLKKHPQPVVEPPSPPPAPTGPYLESVDLPGDPRRLYLKPDGATVGQAPENDMVITPDFPHWETVSRRHARIYAQAGRWIVEDLDSTNGVYVNGQRTGRNLLRDGWRLGIGGVQFVFHANTGEA